MNPTLFRPFAMSGLALATALLIAGCASAPPPHVTIPSESALREVLDREGYERVDGAQSYQTLHSLLESWCTAYSGRLDSVSQQPLSKAVVYYAGGYDDQGINPPKKGAERYATVLLPWDYVRDAYGACKQDARTIYFAATTVVNGWAVLADTEIQSGNDAIAESPDAIRRTFERFESAPQRYSLEETPQL
jgi:hypothetical protein